MKYRFLEDKAIADICIEAFGKNYEELFVNSALALTECMVRLKDVKPKIKETIKFKNIKIEQLLYDFLSELVYTKDVNQLLFVKYNMKIKQGKKFELTCDCIGDKINMNTQELIADVKAITMHMFKIEKTKNGFKATFVPDI